MSVRGGKSLENLIGHRSDLGEIGQPPG